MNKKMYALCAALVFGNQMAECKPIPERVRVIQAVVSLGVGAFVGKLAYNSTNGEPLDAIRKRDKETIEKFKAKEQAESKKTFADKLSAEAAERAMLSHLTPEARAEALRKKREHEEEQRRSENSKLRDALNTEALDDEGLTRKRNGQAWGNGIIAGIFSALGTGVISELIVQAIKR